MRSRNNTFQTIRSEGGLLPSDLLQRLSSRDGEVPGLSDSSYHLSGEKLNEAINRSWNRLTGAWKAFQGALADVGESEPATTVTREKWLLPLFEELKYGRLQTARAREIEGKTYPISHGWGALPIHLVGARVELDRRTEGVAGASRSSPHSMVQEFLNRDDDCLWAIVSNGLKLRVLRDNITLTRQAYVEFDVAAMFEGEAYSDFVVLWLVCHQSRVEAENPNQCWLEKWSQFAEENGTRALEKLRQGVERAIESLGRGFIAHPANFELQQKLRSGELDKQEYYRQLLRLIYRFIFLFVAEDRSLLLKPGTPAPSRKHYYDYYSLSRLRDLAERRIATQHIDLWKGLTLLFDLLEEKGCPALGLPALGSFLWSRESTAALDDAVISNRDLLRAVYHLSFVQDGKVRRLVDYRNLGAEELGSIYEALLEMHPRIDLGAKTFALATAAGNERKTTGSYYTPTSLVNCLLDSALDPVIDDRVRWAERLSREVANRDGKQGLGIRELGIRERKENGDKVVSGSEGLAAGDGGGGDVLSADKGVSAGGDVRHDVPDSSGGVFDTSQHSRGLGARGHTGVHSLSSGGAGKSQGAGNASDPGNAGGVDNTSGKRPDSGSLQRDRAHDSLPDWYFAAKARWERALGKREIASREIGNNATPPLIPNPYLPTSPIPSSLITEEAILSLKICDPACGSGHFLIAAAHRLAKRLAAVRTGDEEPSPEEIARALRDVIGRCIFGVDINPMAVELCKVSLWMEAIEPGKPLSFLDHHIQCGNSLLGTTPALLARGIPDDAYKPITGDDKSIASAMKKMNKEAREQGQNLFDFSDARAPWEQLGNIPRALSEVEQAQDDSLDDVHKKEQKYVELVQSTAYENARLLADAWCAAFVWPKDEEHRFEQLHTEHLKKIERNPHSVSPSLKDRIRGIAQRYQFLHWHLAYPQVFRPAQAASKDDPLGWEGGFDCVLGNPPWEHVELKEKEWFAERDPEIANAPNASARKKRIEALQVENPALWEDFAFAKRRADGEMHLIRSSMRYPFNGRGRINTYAIFAEGNRQAISRRGRAGFIVPSGIATDDTTKFYFQDIVEKGSLVSLYDFENREAVFPGVHRSYKFCLLTLAGPEAKRGKEAEFVFFAHQAEQLTEPDRCFTLTAEEIALLNPNTRTCPIFRSRADAELTKAIYRRVPVLIKEARDGQPEENPWGISFKQGLFNMASDSHLFRTREELEARGLKLVGNVFTGSPNEGANGQQETWLPLYEAKMIHHFDHRWATYINDTESRDVTLAEKQDPNFVVMPRYWVEQTEVDRALPENAPAFLFGWRDITNVTNERTTIFSSIPKTAVGHTAPLAFSSREVLSTAGLLAATASLAADFVARQAVGGTHLTYGYLRQLCFPYPSGVSGVGTTLLPRMLELTYTSSDIDRYALALNYEGPPFRWDEERRYLIRCELDAAFFHLYLPSDDNGDWKRSRTDDGAVVDETEEQLTELKKHFPKPRDAVAYIMETFPIVKRKDEKAHGHYRTKDTILEIYDAMLEAQRTGRTYQSRLEPQPGDLRAAHLPAIPTGQRMPFSSPKIYTSYLLYALLRRCIEGCSLAAIIRAFSLLRAKEQIVAALGKGAEEITIPWARSFSENLQAGALLETFMQLHGRKAIKLDEDVVRLAVNDIPEVPPWVALDADLSLRVALSELDAEIPLSAEEEACCMQMGTYARTA